MHGWAVFIIVVIVLAILGAGGWFAYQRFYKKRNESTFAYPSPAPSGIADKLKDVWHRVRNPKTQTGAGYEGSGYRGVGGRGRGHALDPDEAWDSRVGNEADVYGPGGYYEEQELGLQQPTEYRGATGGGFRQTETLGAPTTGDRGRSKSPSKSTNPFGDDNAASLRSVSPRPHVDTGAGASHGAGRGSAESSPTFERRSVFRENM